VYKVELRRGDIVFLCTDGITRDLGNDTIVDCLTGRRESLEEKAHNLVNAANLEGGSDNITVILAQFS
jgi:protein phosphatase